MSNIFMDIETLPTDNPEVISMVKSKLTAPSNYKDPEKISAYIEDKADEAIHKTGLSGLFGRVLCFGYAIDDQPAGVVYGKEASDEKFILQDIRRIICTNAGRKRDYCANTLIGHNLLGFDIPFLSQRMMVNGLPPLFEHGTKPWDTGAYDTSLMFACGNRDFYSLENLCLAFGVKSPKGEIDGSMVAQAYRDGRHDQIIDYCADDVRATRELYLKMKIETKE